MTITIALKPETAEKLSRQAQGNTVTLQEWVVRILEDAADHNHGASEWTTLNARRLALIAKEFTSGLHEAEQAELATLQDAVAKACEPEDRRLLEKLAAWEGVTQQNSTPCHE